MMAAKRQVEIIVKAKDETKKGFNSVNKNMDSTGKKAESTGKQSALAIAAIGAAALLAAKQIYSMISSLAAVGDAMDKMSQRTGVAVDELNAWIYSAELSGSSSGAMEAGIRRLTKSMYDQSQGLSTAVRAWEGIGVSTQNADGSLRDATDVLFDLSDAFKEVTGQSEKMALAQELLGRGGVALLPMLQQGSDALREQADEYESLHGSSTQFAKDSAELVDAQLRLKTAFEGVKISVFSGLIVQLSEDMNALAKSTSFVREVISKIDNFIWADWKEDVEVVIPLLSELAQKLTEVYQFGGNEVPLLFGEFEVNSAIAYGEALDAVTEAANETRTALGLIAFNHLEAAPVIARDFSDALGESTTEIGEIIEGFEEMGEQIEVTNDTTAELENTFAGIGMQFEGLLASSVFTVMSGEAVSFGNILKNFVMSILSQIITKLIIIKLLSPLGWLGFDQGGQVPGMAAGGKVPGMAQGGSVAKAAFGYSVPDGPRGQDSRMIMAMPGEEVINRQMSRRLNRFLSSVESSAYISPWDTAGAGGGAGNTVVMNVGIPQSQAGLVTMARSVESMLKIREGGAL